MCLVMQGKLTFYLKFVAIFSNAKFFSFEVLTIHQGCHLYFSKLIGRQCNLVINALDCRANGCRFEPVQVCG